MHIVIVHGYFLKGTGSNLFVRNICRELCKIGHQVSLFCQEKDISDIDFIEKAFEFDENNERYELFHDKETRYKGKCTLFRPNIHGLLPVFIYDRYEGYTAKEFPSCTQEELNCYIEYNRSAIDHVLQGDRPRMVISNHTVMQPIYVARSVLARNDCLHVMVVHGSCLNFAVKKSQYLKEYALESIEAADRIVFVSEYSKQEFLEYFEYDRTADEKSVVIPAGVDLGKFLPLDESVGKCGYIQKMLRNLAIRSAEVSEGKSSWKTDEDVVETLSRVDFENERIVLYYGKYLWTKGIQLLIAASPLVMQTHPSVRFILVGYGSSRAYFKAMIDALDSGDRDGYLLLLKHPERFDESIEHDTSRFFLALVDRLQSADFADRYFSAAQDRIQSAIILTGFLGHDQLRYLVACADIMVAPSIFPEAFGLVAAEALSGGIIPIQTNHSGFAEVIRKYVAEFSDVFDKTALKPLYLDGEVVLNMANNIAVFLDYYDEMSPMERRSIRQRARKVSADNYSWKAIVSQYLQLDTTGG
jgi:glycosyltransferase involved in cell wall biosynthesis